MLKVGQVPFLRFLIPIIAGIVFSRYITFSRYIDLLGALGLIIMLIGYYRSRKQKFEKRWIFGFGLTLFLFSFSVSIYRIRVDLVSTPFIKDKQGYVVEIMDYPQHKKRSVACAAKLNSPINKKILLYLQRDSVSIQLKPGDEILMNAKIDSLRNMNNPDDFDYKFFMNTKGFSGTAFIDSSSWIKTGRSINSVRSKALITRRKIIDLFKSFRFNQDESGFLYAITLGYKDDITPEMKQAFSSSGTSHILAVSGLHVGIIYLMISSILSFLGNRGRGNLFKQLIIIFILWNYVFLTGLPISVIRAAIMISLICIGSLFNRNAFSYNTLFIAAFFILLFNPFVLFDVGFQLSFLSVFSILYFQPKLSRLYYPKSSIIKYFFNLLTVSIAAQLGVFPLILFYFGIFPTYFFISNLLIIPLLPLIIYLAFILLPLSFLITKETLIISFIYKLLTTILQYLIQFVLKVNYFFESLPYSVIGSRITLLQVVIVFSIIVMFIFFIEKKQFIYVIYSLLFLELYLLLNLVIFNYKPNDHLFVYNNFYSPTIGYSLNNTHVDIKEISNQVLYHPEEKIILLSRNIFKIPYNNSRINIDYIIVAVDNTFSIRQLLNYFNPNKIIIDSSISNYASERMKNECLELGISFHDVADLGAYCIFF